MNFFYSELPSGFLEHYGLDGPLAEYPDEGDPDEPPPAGGVTTGVVPAVLPKAVPDLELMMPPLPSGGTSINTRKKRKEEMKQATIRQHYYPESGWGWVVVFVAFLVQVITHGFQMAYGVTLLAVLKRWGPSR